MSDLGFVHRFIPSAVPKYRRTLLLLHGTGGDENDLVAVGRAIDPQASLLSPRGKILERGAPRFFRRLAEGVFDEPDVIARAHELGGFVVAAAREYRLPLEDLIAVGYSNGANIAAAMLLLGVGKFSKAVLFRAMLPLSQPRPVDLNSARVLTSAGERDPIANRESVTALIDALRRSGADVTLKIQPSGHELTEHDIATARDWLTSSS